MDDKLYKVTKKAKKAIDESDKHASLIKAKQQRGEPLTFKERNILNVYNKKLQKEIKRSLNN